MRRQGAKKIMHGILAVVLLCGISFSIAPRVNAQAAVVATNPDLIVKMTIQDILKKMASSLKDALVSSLSAEMVNLVSMMANQLASNTAVWIASGGNAESPLYNALPAKDYFKYAGARVISEVYNDVVLENLEDGMWPTLNVYINTDPQVLSAIRAGIKSLSVRPEISFEYPSIKNNWAGYLATLSATDLEPEVKTAQVLGVIAQAFNSDVNELSAIAQVEMYALSKAQSEASAEEKELLANDGFQAIVHYITGQVETPASLVKQQLETSLEIQAKLPFELNTSLLANSDTLLSIGMNAGTIFTNTLFSQLMNKFQSGYFSDISTPANPFDENSTVEYSRERIAEIFRSITTFKPLEITDYSLLSDLVTCPSIFRGSSRNIFNCALDSSFASAITLARTGNSLTLQDAIDEGYIKGSWPLIPSSDTARNQDTKCYTYGFCHSNLVKLRKARIIPIGWELATESDNNSDSNPVTLQEVIDGFYSCNADGELDDEHPWCHLIDPGWVIKFPETQCRTLAYGQVLASAGTDERAEECVDIQSCISEDANGNCQGGYGACVREKNEWQFRGDECPAQYASCLSFESENGTPVDFLTNTLDYGDCSASNMGCMWYAVQKEEGTDGFDWPTILSVGAEDIAPDAYKNRIYFNDEVVECDSQDAGCSALYVREDETALNMLSNPSFELDANEDAVPDGWVIDGSVYSTDGTQKRTGTDSLDLESVGGSASRMGIVLKQSQFYALSFYAKTNGTGSYVGTASLTISDENGSPTNMSVQTINSDCSGDCLVECYVPSTDQSTVVLEVEVRESGFTRFECVFTTPTLVDRSLDLHGLLVLDGDIVVDDIQLEQSPDTTTFTDGYNSDSLNTVYTKIAPDYLGCTGADTDADECDAYAQVCTEQDAGCGLYIPENGDPSVTAVVSELDMCPSVCVGYDTYKQEPTTYEADGEFPVYFIADSADSCSESAVGCTEFTNLETEEREYFTYLRTCLTEAQADANPSGNRSAVYYTWEGSDEEGYQLRTWNLLESDLDGSAYLAYLYTDSSEIDTNPGLAPCTNWTTTANGIVCQDDSESPTMKFDTDSSSCDEHFDTLTNPDCREFYDAGGAIHYRLWSETVTVNDACGSYRLTDLPGDTSTDWATACNSADGYYDATAGFCRFYGYSDESQLCSSSQNGCRSYTGGRSGNSRIALEDLFEDGSISTWDSDSASLVTLSNESVAFGGHSLKSSGRTVWTYLYDYGTECAVESGCSSTGSTLGGSCTVAYGERYCGTLDNQLFTNKTYTLTFWAKGNVNILAGLDEGALLPDVAVDAYEEVELDSQWRYYSVGPFDMNETDYPNFENGSVLVFEPNGGSGDFYIDNIVLREGEDNITVIRDSWNTPMACDYTLEGTISPQYHLGCQEYTDQNGTAWNLKSFRNLCGDDKVGCDAFYLTEQSDLEYSALYNATCYNTDSTGGSWSSADIASAKISCYLNTNSDGTSFDTTSPVLCSIIAGEDSCKFDLEGWFIPEYETVVGSGDSTLYHISYGPDAVVVEPDQSTYIIYDEELSCSSTFAGCTQLGEPDFSNDLSRVDDWTDVYLVNDPDSYDTTLCNHDELFCKEWETDNNGTWYFKDPIGHTCEYKTDITVNGTSYTGWFQQGTSEFCYGTGTCSGNGALTCSSDAQCALAGAGDCSITVGSYLIGGTNSGIWRNGDVSYDGWVGECSAQYNACTAFEDPLDIAEDEFYSVADGETYYYIDNELLDDSSLLSSQRCKGQVSQKEGCALFYDAGDTSMDYNSSATYTVSAHADELAGKSAYSLVNPVDCSSSATSTITLSDGSTFDPCESRCVYYVDDFEDLNPVDLGPDDLDSFAIFGNSCYVDDDCPKYEGYTRDIVNGHCFTNVRWVYGASGTQITSDVPRLENDTNRVLSVSQNRVCSEWLSCSSSYSIWDQSAGKYRTICDGIDLCTEYSAEGHPSFCSEWDSDNAAVVLDTDKYVSRDVSFYGEEYSGYAVPNVFPLQHLEQVNIAPPAGYCNLSDMYEPGDTQYDDYHGQPCNTDSDCYTGITFTLPYNGVCVQEEIEDYRLGYTAGACDEDYAQDCSIGYCSDNGSACTDETDCEGSGAVCTTGVCYALSETSCSTDSECSSNQECLSGLCVAEGGFCDMYRTCTGDDAGSACFVSASAREGGCYRGSCFLAMDGEAYNNSLYEGQVCRAYPEVNSPFGNNIVTQWKYWDSDGSDLELTDSYTLTDTVSSIIVGGVVPSTRLSGFDQVELCASGEDCVCSYTKLSTGTGIKSYVSASSTLSSLGVTGICDSASAVSGSLCFDDSDCGSGGGVDGTCVRIVEENTSYGLTGYCLERDTGLSIEGDQYKGACLTWFPVDQLSGATDLYAKYQIAGFFEDTYMCSYVSPYVDLLSENYEQNYGTDGVGVACAEVGGACNRDNQWTRIQECAQTVACPNGYFAILGRCGHDDGTIGVDAETGAVWGDTAAYACVEVQNDCPYICVAEDSVHSDPESDNFGELCIEDIENDSKVRSRGTSPLVADHSGISTHTPYYIWSHSSFGGGSEYDNDDDGTEYYRFTDAINEYADCVSYGFEIDSDSMNLLDYIGGTNGYSLSGAGGFRKVDVPDLWNAYPGCRDVIQVASSTDGSSAPYTNMLYEALDQAISTDVDDLEYRYSTFTSPFGSAIDPELYTSEAGLGEFGPEQIASCSQYEGMQDSTDLTPHDVADGEVCSPYDIYQLDSSIGRVGTDPANPDARSFIDFTYRPETDGWFTTIWEVSEDLFDVFGRISQVYANPVGLGKIWTWVGDFGSAKEYQLVQDVTSVGGDANYTPGLYDLRSTGVPPTVWSVDLENCGTRYCEEGEENSLTLNSQNEGDLQGADGFFRATLKFFAAAYKEQLPIRRIIVDWGDGSQSGSDSSNNYYKNHRGLQEDSLTDTMCDLGTEWGMTSESCDPNYFTYQHAYRCSSAKDHSACVFDAEGNLTNSPCQYDEDTCAFQPRVHVRDNWGWCTGSCGSEGEDGCFDYEGTLSGTDSSDNCDYTDIINDPWINYNGVIYVQED